MSLPNTVRLKPSLSLSRSDVPTLQLACRISRAQSFAEYVRRLIIADLRRVEAEHFGTPAERQRLAILSFLQNGCRSLEDVRSVCQSLEAVEVEAILFSLEQDNYLIRQNAKRGRTWHWEITPKGTAKLNEKGLFV